MAAEEQNPHRLRLGSTDSLLLPGLIDDVALNCLAWVRRSDYPSLSCVSKKYNKLINDGHLFALRKELGIVEYLVFMVCDPRGWLMFSPMRKKWMVLPKMPCDECFNHADKESLAVDDELLVFGRELFQFAIWKYSVRSRREIHSPRRLCSGFFMDGKFYVIGGMSGPNVSVTCGEEFDLETRKWRRVEGMYPNVNRAAQAPPLVVVVNNELFTLEYLTSMVKRYEKKENKWEVMGRLPPMVDSSNGWGLAFKPCGDQLLVFCGQRGVNGEGIVVNAWCPSSGGQDGNLDWKVIGVKENVGVFVYNCAVMGC